MSSANTTVLSQEEYDQRRKLWEGIKSLIKSEQEELYRILKRNEVEITENTNGIFFDVSALKRDTFIKLNDFMTYCLQNRNEQARRTDQMNAIRDECITSRDIVPNSSSSFTSSSNQQTA